MLNSIKPVLKEFFSLLGKVILGIVFFLGLMFILYIIAKVGGQDKPPKPYSGDVRTWEDKQKEVTCWILTDGDNKPITMNCLRTGGKK